MFTVFLFLSEVDLKSSITIESSGLYSVQSELRMKVKKEDKDAKFYCEVLYFVPGATKMTESQHINITVYCEFHQLKPNWLPFGFQFIPCSCTPNLKKLETN